MNWLKCQMAPSFGGLEFAISSILLKVDWAVDGHAVVTSNPRPSTAATELGQFIGMGLEAAYSHP